MANKFREIPKQEEIEELEELVKLEEPKLSPKASKQVKKGVLAKGLSKVFGGSFLSDDRAIQHIPFILFLGMIAILYIANGYYADDKIREVNKVSNQIKELHTEYISSKSDLMFVSKQSEVAKAVAALGLKEPVVAPMKIEMDSVKPGVRKK
ncbi:MAG: hypothetical protein K0R26_155 [Bacteroidota bacterium]|nr:hypothetical protein [Bacteroidota bacterium]